MYILKGMPKKIWRKNGRKKNITILLGLDIGNTLQRSQLTMRTIELK